MFSTIRPTHASPVPGVRHPQFKVHEPCNNRGVNRNAAVWRSEWAQHSRGEQQL